MYTVALWAPSDCRPGWDRAIGPDRHARTKREATTLARRLLAPHVRYETDYSARVGRGHFARVLDHHGERVAEVSAEVRIVPSAGELGWTP